MYAVIVFENSGWQVFMSLHADINVRACSLHNRITQATLESINDTLLVYNQWLCFMLFEVLVNFVAHRHGLDGGLHLS